MRKDLTDTILAGMDRSRKKQLLDNLASSLFKDFSGAERKKFLHKIMSGDKTNLPVIDMVEH